MTSRWRMSNHRHQKRNTKYQHYQIHPKLQVAKTARSLFVLRSQHLTGWPNQSPHPVRQCRQHCPRQRVRCRHRGSPLIATCTSTRPASRWIPPSSLPLSNCRLRPSPPTLLLAQRTTSPDPIPGSPLPVPRPPEPRYRVPMRGHNHPRGGGKALPMPPLEPRRSRMSGRNFQPGTEGGGAVGGATPAACGRGSSPQGHMPLFVYCV